MGIPWQSRRKSVYWLPDLIATAPALQQNLDVETVRRQTGRRFGQPRNNAQQGRVQPALQGSQVLVKAAHAGIDAIGHPAGDGQTVALYGFGSEKGVADAAQTH